MEVVLAIAASRDHLVSALSLSTYTSNTGTPSIAVAIDNKQPPSSPSFDRSGSMSPFDRTYFINTFRAIGSFQTISPDRTGHRRFEI